MFTPKHFRIEELIPPPQFLPLILRQVYQREPARLFRCLPWPLLVTLDRLRDRFGPCTINTWYGKPEAEWKNSYCFFGFRHDECPEGAELSEHKFFRAVDCKFRNTSPAEIWEELYATPNLSCFEHIQRIEAGKGMTWFHFDLGSHDRYGKAIQVIPYRGDRGGLPVYVERERRMAA